MRIRLFAFLLVAGTLTLTLSLIRGQERVNPSPPASVPAPISPPPATPAPPAPAVVTPKSAPALRPISELNKLQQQVLLTAQRGSEWLFSMNGVKGKFRTGFSPALRQVMEGDNFFHQAGAALTLARAARCCGEERYAIRATQAILSLLEETVADARDSRCRHTAMPPALANRLGATAALVLAINELPTPQKDLLERSEEMCRYIERQARPDGSLCQTGDSKEEVVPYHGMALRALMLSHRRQPAAWKVDLVRKALPYYRAWWKRNGSMPFVHAQMAAYAEAYLITKEKVFADFVFEMSDWLCTMQYVQINEKRMLWYGGFLSYSNGPAETMPDAGSGQYGEALAEACRVARELGDLDRFQRCSEGAERCTQFLATLQYTDAVTQHYQPWFRPQILGAFHASHQDGNLRIDYTQHAVNAMFGYLEYVTR